MNKSLLIAALLILGTPVLPVAVAEQNAPVVTLVRVIELSAVGPDGQSYVLYRNPKGVLTADRDLGQVTYLVKAGTLPEGGYHTLSVRLADEATALYRDGRQEPRSLKAKGLPDKRSIEGMLWVQGGDVQPRHARRHPSPVRYRHDNDD